MFNTSVVQNFSRKN